MNVRLRRALRPVRLGFLVRPSDNDGLWKAIHCCTILWGGVLNPIIPVYFRRSREWRDKLERGPSAGEILHGYLDAFEPDYLVKCSKGTYPKIPLPEYRILQLEQVLAPHERREPIGYGLSVTDVYKHLYRTERQFQRREQQSAACLDSNVRTLFAAACFGDFPSSQELQHIQETYEHVFEAHRVSPSPENIFDLLAPENLTPLRIGSYQLRSFHRTGRRAEPTLFYMDMNSWLDIVDYWNLRAAGWRVRALPRQWAHGMQATVVEFLRINFVPYPHDPTMMHHTVLLRGRSVAEQEVLAYGRGLKLEKPGMLVFQHWYPRMWDEWARDKDSVTPVSILAHENDLEVEASGDYVAFKGLEPHFAREFGGRGSPRWVTVVQMDSHDPTHNLAAVIPKGISNLGHVLEGTIGEVWPSTEGIVLASSMPGLTNYWGIPTAIRLFEVWMEENGCRFELSSAGKLASRMIEQLGGTSGAWVIANAEILKLLERMAQGSTVPFGELSQRIGDIYPPQRRAMATTHLQTLTRRGILRLGVEAQCPACQQRTWYGLGELRDELRCDKCLSVFKFPSDNPPPSPWYFRTTGPFSIKNYAHGAYCVALALRFFLDNHRMHSTGTAVPSFMLQLRQGASAELDFGIFWRSTRWFDSRPYLILGECKTFDSFDDQDVARLRSVARQFPGAVLAFCTLKTELTRAEKRRIRSLATRGRRHWRADRWLNPVLVLTATELFSSEAPPYCWEEVGGRFRGFAATYKRVETLLDLCEATERIHLDMESRYEWLEAVMQKRLAKKRTPPG